MLVIDRVQGRNIRHLKDLIRAVESADDEFVSFQDSSGQIIVLEREQAEKSNRGIQRRFGVPFDRSEDLRKGSRAKVARADCRVRSPITQRSSKCIQSESALVGRFGSAWCQCFSAAWF